MSERDRRLAEKYAAKGKKSATETSRVREATKPSRRSRTTETPTSRVPAESGGSKMDAMRRALGQPRSDESRARAKAHQRSLPPLG
jgi:hypothetical protein